jgi:ABC-type sugar transport system substrate-binding protein
LAETARAAAVAGVGWVVLNREAHYLAALRAEFPKLPIFCITANQVQVGHLQGGLVKSALPGGGHVIYIKGRMYTSTGRRRLQGFQEELAGGPWTVTMLEGDWSIEGGRRAMHTWLSGDKGSLPAPGVVCAQNDSMAVGAQEAYQETMNRSGQAAPELPFIGCDGSLGFGQRLVREKKLLATVEVPSSADLAMEFIARVCHGGSVPAMQVLIPVRSILQRDG